MSSELYYDPIMLYTKSTKHKSVHMLIQIYSFGIRLIHFLEEIETTHVGKITILCAIYTFF